MTFSIQVIDVFRFNVNGAGSFHNYKVAFDFVPIVHGKPAWNDIYLFITCGKVAEACGLEWAGRWKTFKEYGHCQYTNGLTIADFKEGKHL